MEKYLYDDYVITLSNKFKTILDDIMYDFNFDLGPEFEIAICKILRNFLPQKYGICRGHVVSKEGDKQGDDIIIYDQERFPTLRLYDKNDYSRKENIPIEAVYAYIEAKHTLDNATFDKAFQQITKVKELIHSREQVGLYQNDPYIASSSKVRMESLPAFRNPVFTMIISRYSVNLNNKKCENADEIKLFLQSKLDNLSRNEYSPELIVAGKSNFLSVGYRCEKGTDIPTKFLLPDKFYGYQNMEVDDLSYGIALGYLLMALDYIRLGKMPWEEIVNDAKLKNGILY